MLEMEEKKIPGTGLCPNVVMIGDVDEVRDDVYQYPLQISSGNPHKFGSDGIHSRDGRVCSV